MNVNNTITHMKKKSINKTANNNLKSNYTIDTNTGNDISSIKIKNKIMIKEVYNNFVCFIK